MTAPLVLCLGHAVIDQVFTVDRLPKGPAKYFASDYDEIGGGPAANAAVTVARLGGRAQLICRLGNDVIGDRIVSELAAEKVDCTLIRRFSGHRSSVSAVLVDRRGERLIVNHSDSTMPDDPGWLPLERVRPAAAVLADIRWPQGAEAVLAAASQAGVPAVLDADRGPAPIPITVLRAASHVVFSQPGLTQTTGIAAPDPALARAATLTDAFLAVTLGADGILWRQGDRQGHVAAIPVEAVDTLGAGDVFHGAFALALAQDQPVESALHFAAAAAALKCTHRGGRRGIPNASELARFLEEKAA